MNWSSSTITGLSSDTGPTIVITFESGKYVFNVGEGTTRAHLQTRRGWKKVKAMFLTQATTERMGGMTSACSRLFVVKSVEWVFTGVVDVL